MDNRALGAWWLDDDGNVAAGFGDDYVTLADLGCNDLPKDAKASIGAQIVATPDLLAACRAVDEADRFYSQAMDLPRGAENEDQRRKAIAHAVGLHLVALEKVRAAILKAAGG